ncbi:MAG: heterodisulfide reductase-related iron-sulfur binding cluster [Actinomycetota bacterium]|nr:heterodisulfide reductase-related iron-sulfur binding cluster [Actinomycetota bacterium]
MQRFELKREIIEDIESEANFSISVCASCNRCTSGCPVVDEMDFTPAQIIRLIQLGDIQPALLSRTIWLCASCSTCTSRCPAGVDVARVMDILRERALRSGVRPALKEVALFNEVSVKSIERRGRLYEFGSMVAYKLKSGDIFSDIWMGIKMFLKGRMSLFPSSANFPSDLLKVEKDPLAKEKIAYFSGCSMHSIGKELNSTSLAVLEELGIEASEPEGWVCCGTTPAHSTSHLLATVLPAKNLALIERKGYDYLTVPCAACFFRMKAAGRDMKDDPGLKGRVDQKIGYSYGGGVEVDHLLTTLSKRVEKEEIISKVKKPLAGLKVACYYGCFLSRPAEVTGSEHPEYPTDMDQMMRLLGAETIDWSHKTECCGAALSMTKRDMVLKLSERILSEAKALGADAVITSCPLCHVNLDARQSQIKKKFGKKLDLPILYFTQLMALSFGLDEGSLGFKAHFVDPALPLKKRGLL